MCRHLAYLGPPRTLAELLLDPQHGLVEQSFAPRRQEHGRVNADGFGLGWWTGDRRPARYRRAVPVWADPNLEDLARNLSSGAVVGAVRDASTGSALGEAAAAPFDAGGILFSHNGSVEDWRDLPEQIDTGLGRSLPPGLEALSDSALMAAMVGARLADGRAVGDAVAAVVARIAAVRPEARMNLLAVGPDSIVATRWGDSLVYRRGEGRVWVASEPTDGDDDWREVPQYHLILATAAEAEVRPLPIETDRAA
ncbi:ergothioneine biosynthesis protein EgtC [Glycomyces xiaoerkulensis]|uniref:ergothioneine biosynthesis protein EgtC n=1 Tax=Glycomyces xiaoerkulensis TaxID=2038139 RepID=UPI000C2599CF|nr:ergothioneine biosynthesis protein EgtC [Glycomyces xiaoerkulensis]